MPHNVQHLTNKTAGKEHQLPCIKCVGKTTHKVLVSVDVRGDEGDEHYSYSWAEDYQVVQCQGCKTVSFRSESSNSEDYHQEEDGTEWGVVEKLYPTRLEGRKGLGGDVHYLPQNVRRIYDETLMAMSNPAPVLAGIGLRALLETVCKEKKATGKDLYAKLDNLKDEGVLTPPQVVILHKIRTLGNAAAHEVKPHSDKQLGLAMDIVEHVLNDVYILPKKAELEFDE
ncbi:DUF4145 domain-containing protein [Cupriavidus consociatus]|uniref:DUF4145 domain-containing protein n=1 Tax=Cupriavidus consociatus TaxID=2821357 RepID=UPI001AE27131|nr:MULTISPECIES: DUF4145 domain-containing protein [unclassified Cupriavidus]MBP0624981.1 DUF4145 domain-containing protein [Cupriavidus sp. LEh25]MDK2661713.1 DUF4145 domain-containing protein [Cupriavidus sp. LEh21]